MPTYTHDKIPNYTRTDGVASRVLEWHEIELIIKDGRVELLGRLHDDLQEYRTWRRQLIHEWASLDDYILHTKLGHKIEEVEVTDDDTSATAENKSSDQAQTSKPTTVQSTQITESVTETSSSTPSSSSKEPQSPPASISVTETTTTSVTSTTTTTPNVDKNGQSNGTSSANTKTTTTVSDSKLVRKTSSDGTTRVDVTVRRVKRVVSQQQLQQSEFRNIPKLNGNNQDEPRQAHDKPAPIILPPSSPRQRKLCAKLTAIANGSSVAEAELTLEERITFIETNDHGRLETRWIGNEFPYAVADGVAHDLIWCAKPLDQVAIQQIVNKYKPEQCYDAVWFVNPGELRSVMGVFHAHVFSRSKLKP